MLLRGLSFRSCSLAFLLLLAFALLMHAALLRSRALPPTPRSTHQLAAHIDQVFAGVALFDCADLPLLQRLDAAPFARGFAKAAWRVVHRHDAQRRVFVLKAPVPSNQHEFLHSARREVKMLRQLEPQANRSIAHYFGSCLRGSNSSGIFIEGPLLRWPRLVGDDALPWCVRLLLARQLLHLLALLERRHLVHCDWKSDQVAVHYSTNPQSFSRAASSPSSALQLDVKLVDLKSLKWFRHNKTVGDSSTPCESHGDCQRATHSACFAWQLNDTRFAVPDYRCDAATHRCTGIDSRSMVFATKQLFFDQLLLTHIDSFPSHELRASLRYTLAKMARLDAAARPSAKQLLAKFDHLVKLHRARECVHSAQQTVVDTLRRYIALQHNTIQLEKCINERYC